MYALLMLLPQSEAFKTLHARLHSVPTVTLLKMDSQPPPQDGGSSSYRDAASRRSQDSSDNKSVQRAFCTICSQCLSMTSLLMDSWTPSHAC